MWLCYGQGYLEVHKFSSDDSQSSRKMTFLYAKYTQESPNSDFGLFLKLQFYPWVHSWRLQTTKSDFVTVRDIWKYTNFLLKIPSLAKRWNFYILNTLKKVQILILGHFGNLSFSHGSIVEHFKQQRVTLLRSRMSGNTQIFFCRFQV